MKLYNLLSTFVSTALYNRFSQSPAMQKCAANFGCLIQGTRLLRDPSPSSTPSLMKKIGRKTAGIAILAREITGLYYEVKRLYTASRDWVKLAFFFGKKKNANFTQSGD